MLDIPYLTIIITIIGGRWFFVLYMFLLPASTTVAMLETLLAIGC